VLGWDAPYKNVVVLGHLLDAKGQKMSKSKGNVVKPLELIERYGADIVRWYMVAVNQAWDPKLFNEADLKTMSNKPFGTLRNLLSFWELHGGNATPQWGSSHPIDSWLCARTRQTYDAVTQYFDAYKLTDAARVIGELVDDCSTWWLRRSRERLKGGDAGARATCTATFRSLAILLAPLAPFHAEYLWQTLRQDGSVHLASWDAAAPPALTDDDMALLQQMVEARRLCSLGLEARASANIPVRQALAKLEIKGGANVISLPLLALIAEEVNVKEVALNPSLTEEVRLDTTLTPELKREGMVRELTRVVNNLRKEMGLMPPDRIRVTYQTGDPELAQAITEQRSQIERTTVSNFSPSRVEGEREGEAQRHTLTISGTAITLDVAADPR